MTWVDIGHMIGENLDHTPVKADVADFDRAGNHFAEIEDALNAVCGELRNLQGCGDQFKGQTATAFTSKLSVLSDDLEKVPRIAYQAKDIMREHAYWLRDIKAEAERALATAKSRKSELEAARDRESDAARRLSSIERQIRSLEDAEAAGDDTASSQLVLLRGDSAAAGQSERSASGDVAHWTQRVHESIGDYERIQDRERELNKGTADRIRHIHFQDLHDPSVAEQARDGAIGLIGDLADFINDMAEFLQSLVELDLAAILWKLDQVLEVVGTVLLAVAIVGAIVGGGPAGLALAALLVASMKFATSATLYSQGWANPETGEKKTLGDVAVDGIGVLMAGVGYKLSSVAKPQTWVFHRGSRITGHQYGVKVGSKVLGKAGSSRVVFADRWSPFVDAGFTLGEGEIAKRIPEPRTSDGPTRAMICPAY